ncbi:hypothetical protein [Magnetococcus sp. PR-3]|uniref:hypothetical protein n=1 Tax=Magnetococcus sp. PR-3 TaxID=3120355 RepID=UPI002FCE0D55
MAKSMVKYLLLLFLVGGCVSFPGPREVPLSQLVIVGGGGSVRPLTALMTDLQVTAQSSLPADEVGLHNLEDNVENLREAKNKIGIGSLLSTLDGRRVPFVAKVAGYDLDGDYKVDQWEMQHAWTVWAAELAVGQPLLPGALQVAGQDGYKPVQGLALSPLESRQVRSWLVSLGQQDPKRDVARSLAAMDLIIESAQHRYEYGGDAVDVP